MHARVQSGNGYEARVHLVDWEIIQVQIMLPFFLFWWTDALIDWLMNWIPSMVYYTMCDVGIMVVWIVSASIGVAPGQWYATWSRVTVVKPKDSVTSLVGRISLNTDVRLFKGERLMNHDQMISTHSSQIRSLEDHDVHDYFSASLQALCMRRSLQSTFCSPSSSD